MKKLFLAISITIVSFFGITHAVGAQDCPVVYGGGPIDCGQTTTPGQSQPTTTPSKTTATPTVTPKPKQPTVTPTPSKTQSKGGQAVAPVATVTTTPPTGPESLSLLALLPMAAFGIYLRRKTR